MIYNYQFSKVGLKKFKIRQCVFASKKVVNFYISYKLDRWSTDFNTDFDNQKIMKKWIFWKMCPFSKQDIKKILRFNYILYKYVWCSVKIFFLKKSAILRLILNNLTFLIGHVQK